MHKFLYTLNAERRGTDNTLFLQCADNPVIMIFGRKMVKNQHGSDALLIFHLRK